MAKEYVIYCRKSTDDGSWRQVQSIPDQIKICMQYAKQHNLILRKRPSDFSAFESEKEIEKQDKSKYAKIYQDAREYFVIQESKSWKIPGIRKKRNALMKLVEKWDIDGIISYSPDRQARNLVDGWKIIDCVDRDLTELKYTTFTFEPNANGKMMLWFWFVLAKQYSDKLWEDASRWIKTKHQDWWALWVPKFWYYINDQWFHAPHDVYFRLMKEAFQMKIYQKKSDLSIIKWLNENGFRRVKSKWEKPILAKSLTTVWTDSFYYGKYVHGKNEIDLRTSKNEFYKPMISEEEHNKLLHMIYWNKYYQKDRKKQWHNDIIRPLPEMFIRSADWYAFTHEVPNRWRFVKKLEKLQETEPWATLKDVVKPQNIKYSVRVKQSEYYKRTIKYSDIEKSLIWFLKNIKINKEKADEYREFVKKQYAYWSEEYMTRRKQLQGSYNNVVEAREIYLEKMMWKDLDPNEEKIYKKKKNEFEATIQNIKSEQDALECNNRNLILEFEALGRLAENIVKYYKKSDYVRKRKLISIFVSHIVVTKQKRLTIAVKPIFKSLFVWNGWGTRTRT